MHNDECVNERDDSQCEQRSVLQGTARNGGKYAEEVVAGKIAECGRAKTGDGNEATHSVYQQNEKRHKHFFSNSLHCEGIHQILKHVNAPLRKRRLLSL